MDGNPFIGGNCLAIAGVDVAQIGLILLMVEPVNMMEPVENGKIEGNF